MWHRHVSACMAMGLAEVAGRERRSDIEGKPSCDSGPGFGGAAEQGYEDGVGAMAVGPELGEKRGG